jgi:cytochrome c5
MLPNKTTAWCAALLILPSLAFATDEQRIERGRAVYQAVCAACHAPANVMVSAPKAGDTVEWSKRASRGGGGIEMLTENALKGFEAMPPKGGRAELTRAQLRDAIEFMQRAAPPSGLVK